MARTDETTIDGVRLVTTSIPVMRALVLWARIGSIVAPALMHVRSLDPARAAALIKAIENGSETDIATFGLAVQALGPAAAELFARMESNVESIARELLSSTVAIVDGKKFELSSTTSIDLAFGDRIGTLIKAAWWSARFNFQGFGVGLRARSDAAPATVSR